MALGKRFPFVPSMVPTHKRFTTRAFARREHPLKVGIILKISCLAGAMLRYKAKRFFVYFNRLSLAAAGKRARASLSFSRNPFVLFISQNDAIASAICVHF